MVFAHKISLGFPCQRNNARRQHTATHNEHKMLNKSSILFKMGMDVGSAIFAYHFVLLFLSPFSAAMHFSHCCYVRLSWPGMQFEFVPVFFCCCNEQKRMKIFILYCFVCGTISSHLIGCICMHPDPDKLWEKLLWFFLLFAFCCS